MDFGVILGLFLGLFMLIAGVSMTEGGQIGQFYNFGSVLITIGGALCAAMIHFSVRDVLVNLPRLIWRVIRPPVWSREAIVTEFRRFAEIARRNGILALEPVAAEITDPFLKRGVQLAVDGTDPRVVEELMRTELTQLIQRQDRGVRLLRALASYSPAFGLVGTLLGQVVMLQNLRSPERVGSAMGLAIINTLYGVLMAYLVYGPIAEKLTLHAQEEETVREMVVRGVMGLQSGDTPAVLEQKLLVYLPPAAREAT